LKPGSGASPSASTRDSVEIVDGSIRHIDYCFLIEFIDLIEHVSQRPSGYLQVVNIAVGGRLTTGGPEGNGWVDWPGLATLLAEAASWIGSSLANWKSWSTSESPLPRGPSYQAAGFSPS
jgi:hypothetical protein